MPSNKYILRFKEVLISDFDVDLKTVIELIFRENNVVKFDFFDAKQKKHFSIFEKYKIDGDFFYGRYGEIKDSNLQNGVAFIGDKEYPDADFKYHVQFLIKYNKDTENPTDDIVFIFNRNALGFEDGFIELIKQNGHVLQACLVEKESQDLLKKLRKARRIKSITVVKDNKPDELKPLFRELYENGIYTTEIKILLKRNKSLSNDEVVSFVEKRKNDATYRIDFVDEDGVDIVKKFTEMITYKSKMISISPEDFSDKDKMFNLMKDSYNE